MVCNVGPSDQVIFMSGKPEYPGKTYYSRVEKGIDPRLDRCNTEKGLSLKGLALHQSELGNYGLLPCYMVKDGPTCMLLVGIFNKYYHSVYFSFLFIV